MVWDKIISGEAEWELLWTNGSSTANFAAQTVSIDLSNYVEIMLVCKYSTSSSTLQNYFAMVGDGPHEANFITDVTTNTQMFVNSRYFEATSSGVSFDANIRKGLTASTAGSTNNGYNIPAYIYAR